MDLLHHPAVEPLEHRLCLTTLLWDDFRGAPSYGTNHGATFSAESAVFRSHDDGIEYDGTVFPSEGMLEVRLRIDHVGSFDRRPGGARFWRSSTILDSAGADERVAGDIHLAVSGDDGLIRFTLSPTNAGDPRDQVQVTSSTPIVDGRCHSIAVSYGTAGIRLFIDGVLEDSDPFPGLRDTARQVSLGDFTDRQLADEDFAFGLIGEVDAIRTSTDESTPVLAPACDPTPGDSNRDGAFNASDIVLVLQANKYLSNEPATLEEGDWNHDQLFNQLDVLAATRTADYLKKRDLVGTLGCTGRDTSISIDSTVYRQLISSHNAEDEGICQVRLQVSRVDPSEPSHIPAIVNLASTVERLTKERFDAPLKVYLTCSNPSIVQVPEYVTIPAGRWTQTVNIIVRRDRVGATGEDITIRTVLATENVPTGGGTGGGGSGGSSYRVIWIYS